jgi:hypothetical protein
MSKEKLKTTLLNLFKVVATLNLEKGKVIECKRPGWGYLLEFDEKTGEVLSQLHHLDLCDDEEYIKDMYSSLITELKGTL